MSLDEIKEIYKEVVEDLRWATKHNWESKEDMDKYVKWCESRLNRLLNNKYVT